MHNQSKFHNKNIRKYMKWIYWSFENNFLGLIRAGVTEILKALQGWLSCSSCSILGYRASPKSSVPYKFEGQLKYRGELTRWRHQLLLWNAMGPFIKNIQANQAEAHLGFIRSLPSKIQNPRLNEDQSIYDLEIKKFYVATSMKNK